MMENEPPGLLFSIAGNFPDFGIRSQESGKYCQTLGVDGGRYSGFSISVALILAIVAGIAMMPETAIALAAALLVFSFSFFLLLRLPENEFGSREMRMEAGMPAVLRTLGMLLQMNVPFVQALKIASHENGNWAAIAFSDALKDVEGGAGLSRALANLAKRSKSPSLKKAITQIISAYSHGGGADGIMRIADDLVSLQKYKIRDFASRSALFGLLFVVSATVVPTFFLVIASVGEFALGVNISREAFIIAFLLVFPAVDLAILSLSKMQMPPGPFGKPVGVGLDGNSPLLFFCFAAFAALAAAFAPGAEIGVAMLSCAGAAGLWLFLGKYNDDKRLEKIEAELPDSLLASSGLPKSRGLDSVFAHLSNLENTFSKEAEKTAKQLNAGLGIEKALDDLWRRNDSQMLKRVSTLMLNANLAGANISEKMHEMAEDLMMFAELRREKENALSMQKYTLFLGALIVPAILSVSLNLAAQISSFIGQGNQGVLDAAPGTINGYIILYSAVSAYYVSSCEERRSSMFAYFLLMAALGLAGFYIVSLQFTT